MGAGPDLLGLYLDEAGSFPLLTKADEMRLGQVIQAAQAAREELESGSDLTPKRKKELRKTILAGEDATTQFINSNLRLVVSVARKYQWSGLPLSDLIQEGNLGLDPRRREVRLAQGLQVLDVRHLVDPAIDWPSNRKYRPYGAYPRSRRRRDPPRPAGAG